MDSRDRQVFVGPGGYTRVEGPEEVNFNYNRGWTDGFKAGLFCFAACLAILGAIAVLLVLT